MELFEAVQKVKYALPDLDEEGRANLHAIRIEPEASREGYTAVVVTDGHRMACEYVEGNGVTCTVELDEGKKSYALSHRRGLEEAITKYSKEHDRFPRWREVVPEKYPVRFAVDRKALLKFATDAERAIRVHNKLREELHKQEIADLKVVRLEAEAAFLKAKKAAGDKWQDDATVKKLRVASEKAKDDHIEAKQSATKGLCSGVRLRLNVSELSIITEATDDVVKADLPASNVECPEGYDARWMGLNIYYLRDALKQLTSKIITVEISDEFTPARFVDVNSWALIMPMRL